MDLHETQCELVTSGSRIKVPLEIKGHNPILYDIEVQPTDHPTAFALSIRKSGSSVFSNIVTAIAENSGRTVVDIPGKTFKNNIAYRHWNDHRALSRLIWPGNIYTGFRDAPTALFSDRVFQQSAKLLLLRDPRDILVSEYFSNAFSHSIPETQPDSSVIIKERKTALSMKLEQYIFSRVDALNTTIRAYRPLIESNKLKLLRYEDVIFDKPSWMRQIAASFKLELSDTLIDDILKWADVRPEKEDPTKFIRRVTPGDYLEKLCPEAISTLEERLDDLWWELGYSRSHS